MFTTIPEKEIVFKIIPAYHIAMVKRRLGLLLSNPILRLRARCCEIRDGPLVHVEMGYHPPWIELINSISE